MIYTIEDTHGNQYKRIEQIEPVLSVAELARRIGQSRQNLYKKLQGDTLTIDEIKQSDDALEVKFDQSFTIQGGAQCKIAN